MLRINRINTQSVSPDQRCALWEQHNSNWLVGLRCAAEATQGLDAQQVNIHSDHLSISHMQANSHLIERDQHHIRHTPQDAIFASFNFKGRARFYQQATCYDIQPTDVLLYHTDTPYSFGFKDDMAQVIVRLPLNALPIINNKTTNTPFRLRAHTKQQQLLLRTLAQYSQQFILQPHHYYADAAYEHIHGMLHALVHMHYPYQSSEIGSPSALASLWAAKQFIAENSHSTLLDNTTIAAAVGLSSRHLQRIFQQYEQISMQRYVLKQRLGRAHRLLLHPRYAPWSIERIAFETGFNSLAHFSRCFKQHYQQSPSLVRTMSF